MGGFLNDQVRSQYTSGKASRSFTSTIFDPVTTNDYEYVQVEKNPKKKGYVRLHTTHGDLNLELHCDITPRTCENFLTLCEQGYYNNVIFHRNIRQAFLSLLNFVHPFSCELHKCGDGMHKEVFRGHCGRMG